MSKPTAVDKFPVMRFSPVNEETGMERDPKGGYVLAQNYEQLLAELEQVKDKLIASEAVIQTQIYGKYGIEHYSKITTELTAEIKRLRDAIDDAPHAHDCAVNDWAETGRYIESGEWVDDVAPCNCWKAALKEQ